MADITAAMVKGLRERTGAGMMDCKASLAENGGDVEKAVDWLRAKGLAKAARKSGRLASEGLVGVAVSGVSGVVLEMNSETDFVARNGVFQEFVRDAANLALGCEGGVIELERSAFPDERGVLGEYIRSLIGSIGENLSLRRMERVCVRKGIVASYVHAPIAPDLGRIGVLVGLESDSGSSELLSIGEQLAMHIAACAPLAIHVDGVSPEVIQRERAIYLDQARSSGKPPEIAEKMVEGRIRKFCEESVLLSQPFVIDGDKTVAQVLKEFGSQVGCSVEVTGFARMELGAGLEKQESDFAAEVASAARV